MKKNILSYLEESAAQFPSKIAFSDAHTSFTYSEFLSISRRIGSTLAAHSLGTRKPILVRMEKSAACIAAFMGVVYSGNFYVPIDVSTPIKRVEKIIALLNCSCIISDAKNSSFFDAISYHGALFLYEDLIKGEENSPLLQEIYKHYIDTDPLYMIFTSGSTGTPKGVTVNHRSVIDFIDHFTETFQITSADVIANQAPFDFDVSVKDIYSTLKTGASLHIVPKTLFILLPKLMSFFNEKKITTVIWAVSALTLLSNMKGFEKEVPKYLTKIMFSGEVMPTKQLNIWRHYLPHATFVNLYGPTEITCNCLYYILDRSFQDNEQLPLGCPFDNTDVFLLDKDSLVSQPNEIGEICIRGTSLALGYYNDPENTAKAFTQNPLNPNYPERIYRTGDLARINEKGELLYSSRKDFQIKHMGHRIELGEIEFAVNSLDEIEYAVCLYNKSTEKIILIYQAKCALDAKGILTELKTLLPKYMFPHEFIQVDKMPFNKNSKIDRVYLKEKYIVNSD